MSARVRFIIEQIVIVIRNAQAMGMFVIVRMRVSVPMSVRVRYRASAPQLGCERTRAEERDEDARAQRYPGIDGLGDDQPCCEEDDGAQRDDAQRVRDGQRGGEDQRLRRRRSRADEGDRQ